MCALTPFWLSRYLTLDFTTCISTLIFSHSRIPTHLVRKSHEEIPLHQIGYLVCTVRRLCCAPLCKPRYLPLDPCKAMLPLPSVGSQRSPQGCATDTKAVPSDHSPSTATLEAVRRLPSSSTASVSMSSVPSVVASSVEGGDASTQAVWDRCLRVVAGYYTEVGCGPFVRIFLQAVGTLLESGGGLLHRGGVWLFCAHTRANCVALLLEGGGGLHRGGVWLLCASAFVYMGLGGVEQCLGASWCNHRFLVCFTFRS